LLPRKGLEGIKGFHSIKIYSSNYAIFKKSGRLIFG